MNLLDMRTATITEKGQISIPKEIRGLEGFEEGDKIAILAFKDKVELRSLKSFSEKMFTAFASEKSLAKDWLSKEDEKVWKDL
ncbi:AbrB/MazE/SpoVT family DNA-binding domain-containing protein [Candidatus Woesearchaeota archaeon]|nr:AbrB/MazE/SpoVT family DNA-binding domain-containing protein [Candidatus Woesearchaeota archaeon]